MAYKFSLWLVQNNQKINIDSITCKVGSETITYNYNNFVTNGPTHVWEELTQDITFTVTASDGLQGWYFSGGETGAKNSDSVNGTQYTYTYKYNSSNTNAVNMRPVPFEGYNLTCWLYHNETLPVDKLEYKIGNGSWQNIETLNNSHLIGSSISGNSSVSLRITKQENTVVSGWYISEKNDTTGSSSSFSDSSTSVSGNQIVYTYTSNKIASTISIRPIFYTYHFRINYKDTPYVSWGGPNKSSLIVAIDNGFKKILAYTFDYPEYQSGTTGGWSTTQNGKLEYYGGQEYELVGEDGVSQTVINVYKAYKNLPYRIKLSLYKNDGSSSSPFKTFEFGREDSSTIQLTNAEILQVKQVSPERSGYEFLGYSTSTTATTATYKFAGSGAANSWSFTGTSSTRNYNLYAVWRIWYEASFTLYANGGQFSDGSTSTTYSEGSSLSNKIVFVPQPTREGYAFLGWATTSSATTTSYGTHGPFDLAQFGKNYTLYAVWQRVYHYKVTYKSGAGKWSNGDTELIDEADTPNIRHWYDLTSNTPTSNTTDYVFKAWSDGYNDFTLPTGLYLEFSETNDSIELTYTAKYGKATEDGVVYINGEPYIPYIYSTINGVEDWRQYEAHIYSSGWKISIE